MVDQTSQFYAILTTVGAAKQANADALGIPWKITQMAVGDGNPAGLENPALPMPDASARALLNEWRRAPLNQLKVDDKNSAVIVAEQVIPADVGGRWIRELALYDADGDMVAVANCAPTYKPLLNQGSGRTQVVRMNLIVSSSSNVQLKIDPSVVLATREWVTEELAKQDFKHSVLVATTAAITLSGLQTVDGVALSAGARVLVKNQAAAKDNGLYLVVAGGAWTRCTDADTSAKVTPGMLVPVEKGTINADSTWQLVTDSPITLGVSALAYEMAFGRTGVAAGSYRSVTVDAYGRVVAATNPTTVAGYGLTDVYTKVQIDQALALKAPLVSPALTGAPTVPTLMGNDVSTKIANAATVRAILAQFGLGTSASNYTGNIDNLVENGVYMVDAATTGTKPEYPSLQGSGPIPNGTVLHMERGANFMATQYWDSLVNAIDPITCTRTRNANAIWSKWEQITSVQKVRTLLDTYGVGVEAVNQPLITNFSHDILPGLYRAFSSGNVKASIGCPPDTGDTSMSVYVGGGYTNPGYKTFLAILNSFTTARMYVGVKVTPGTQPTWTEITTRDHAPFAGVQAFKAAGVFAWTVPSGVKKAWVTVIGGGGGGGRSATSGMGSGGGGGGGLSQKLVDLTGVSTVTVTVGAGGAGATVAGEVGETGGTSSFGVHLSATGGAGGMGANNLVANGPGSSGSGSGGDFNIGLGVGHVSYGTYGGSGGGHGSRATQGPAHGGGGGIGGGGSGATYGYNGGPGGAGNVIIQW